VEKGPADPGLPGKNGQIELIVLTFGDWYDVCRVVDLPSTSLEVDSSNVLDDDIITLDQSDCQTIQLPDGTVAVIRNLSQC